MSQPENRKVIPSAPGASAEPEAFRDVIRHLASGVTIITSSLEGEPVGLTATAVCSISAVPPMLLVSLTATSRTAKGVAETGAFAVHLLPHTGRRYAEKFASRSSHFQDVKYSPTPDRQIPLLPNALGWFLCHAEQSLRVADHVIFVGRVLQCELKDESPDPLVYFDRNYRKLAPAAEHASSTLEPWGSAQDAGLPGFGW